MFQSIAGRSLATWLAVPISTRASREAAASGNARAFHGKTFPEESIVHEDGRTFLRGIGSETYGLTESRARQRGVMRVRRAGTDTDDASVGHSGDSDNGESETWWMLGPGDVPFLTQSLQVHFVELKPGGTNHGHGHQNEAVLEAAVEAYRELLVPSICDLRDDKSGRARQKAHEELVEAVRRHSPEGARDLMLTHLADFEKRLRRGLAGRTEAERPTSIARPRLVRARR